MMSSLRSFSVLRGTRTHPSHWSSSHHLRPSRLTTTVPRISPLAPSHIQHGRRAFHWQSTVNAVIEGSQNLIVNVHTVTHLPWFLTIPLVAFTVGVVFRLPFSIYAQRILQRRAPFHSLLQAWNTRIQYEVHRDEIPASSRLSEVKARQEKVQRRIYQKLGLQQWRLWGSVLSFPFWLIAIDSVRHLCGGPRGLLATLAGGSEGSGESAAASGAGAASATTSAADPSVLDPAVISSAVETAHTAVIDPTLTVEGCLWFTDLTASDPYHILPMALSATLVMNLLPSSRDEFLDRVRVALGLRPKSARAQMLAGDEKVGLGQRISARFHVWLIGLSALIGPLTVNLPAALHLYWLASSLTNALIMKGLQHLMPVKTRRLERCSGLELPVIRPQREQKS